MTATTSPGWGVQLPIQALSTNFAAPWESDATTDDLRRIVQTLDEVGAGYVAVCDHVVIPDSHVDVMGSVWFDTIATLGWIAGFTSKVSLLSHVYVVPYRNPAVVAKAFLTLDELSGGRAILGAGAGHVEPEFAAMGVNFADRGTILTESLSSIREIFQTGRYGDGTVAPRHRDGGPPIWIGGSSQAALRRAAILGDGWLPQGPPKMGMSAALAYIQQLRQEHGRVDLPFDLGLITEPIRIGDAHQEVLPAVLSGSPERIAERLSVYRSRGFTQLQVRFQARDAQDYRLQTELFGTQVWPLVESTQQ